MIDVPVLQVGSLSVTIWAVLAACLLTAVCVWMVFRFRRARRKGGHAALYCAAAVLSALLVGRAVYCALRPEIFLDPLGRFMGVGVFFNPTAGGISVIGALAGAMAGIALTARLLKAELPGIADLFAGPGLILLAGFCFLNPLRGQGYGPSVTSPLLCRVPLGIQNGWGGWALSVSFLEGVLMLLAAGVVFRRKWLRKGSAALCAAGLLSLWMVLPESLRRDDVLRIFTFARGAQLGYALLLIAGSVIIWRRISPAGTRKRVRLRGAISLILGILLLVGAEFALDKTDWPDGLIHLGMLAVLLGMTGLYLRDLFCSDLSAEEAV